MSREREAYRDNLQAILEFSHGRHLLAVGEARQYLGFADNRTVKRLFPVREGFISAETLARCLAGGECMK